MRQTSGWSSQGRRRFKELVKLEVEHRSQYDAYILEHESYGEERVDIFHHDMDGEESDLDYEGSEQEEGDMF